MGRFRPHDFLRLCRGKKVLLLGHENADLDAAASCAIFQSFLESKRISSVIAFPSHLNEQALRFLSSERIPYVLMPDLLGFDLIFLFDFNGFEQLGKLRRDFEQFSSDGRFSVFVFDHHVLEEKSIANGDNAFIDESCVSTTQVLADLLGDFFSNQMHFWNCLGIVEDTGHFLVGNNGSFASFAKSLALSKRSFSDVLFFTKHSFDFGERIAFLKAAQRAQIVKSSKAIIVFSKVSFFQGATATKLLNLGADITLVAGAERKNDLTILSARAETNFKEVNNFNLVRDLMVELQKQIGGDIGGHSGAAQWKGSVAPEKILKIAVGILKKKF